MAWKRFGETRQVKSELEFNAAFDQGHSAVEAATCTRPEGQSLFIIHRVTALSSSLAHGVANEFGTQTGLRINVRDHCEFGSLSYLCRNYYYEAFYRKGKRNLYKCVSYDQL